MEEKGKEYEDRGFSQRNESSPSSAKTENKSTKNGSGDSLPENIKEGDVIKQYSYHCEKYKRMIAIGVGQGFGSDLEIGFAFINSRFPDYAPEEIRKSHIPIKAEENQFLDHDSYIDCSEIESFDYEQVNTNVKRDPSIKYGELNNEDLKQVKDNLSVSRKIYPFIKRKFDL